MANVAGDNHGRLDVNRFNLSVDCQSTEPFFCANVHISCSGQSRIKTFDFTLKVDGESGVVNVINANSEYEDSFAGRITRGENGRYLIFRPNDSRDYFKVMADGSFSQRRYVNKNALMTYGRCSLSN